MMLQFGVKQTRGSKKMLRFQYEMKVTPCCLALLAIGRRARSDRKSRGRPLLTAGESRV